MKTKAISGALTLLSALFVSVGAATGQPSVAISSARGYPGQTATVPILVRQATNLVAAQFDLTNNPARGTLHELSLAARFTNHVVRSREVASGVRRVLVYSPVNALLRTNGFGGAFEFDVPAGERIGSGPINARNVVLARTDATAITPVDAISGSVFVTPVYRNPASGVVDVFLPSVADTRYLIQASEDLKVWTTIATKLATGNFMDLVDLDAPRFAHRFYRSVLYDAAGEIGTITREANGGLNFRLNGLDGRIYVLQASMNLEIWTNMRTNVATGGTIQFDIVPEPGVPRRFFRVESR